MSVSAPTTGITKKESVEMIPVYQSEGCGMT